MLAVSSVAAGTEVRARQFSVSGARSASGVTVYSGGVYVVGHEWSWAAVDWEHTNVSVYRSKIQKENRSVIRPSK